MITKKDKRQKIIEAAVALFSRAHDVKKVSVEDIAAHAGVSPTTIYNYYGTRDALVVDTARGLVKEIMKMTASVLRSDMTFPQKLKAIMAGKMDLAGQYSSEVLGKLLKQDINVTRAGRELYESEVKTLWQEFVAGGKQEGYIDPDMSDEDLLTYFDIVRAGIASRPEILDGYRQDSSKIEKLSEIICFGFLRKDVDLFSKDGPGAAAKGETA